jgi:hypothetical protein
LRISAKMSTHFGCVSSHFGQREHVRHAGE